MPHSSRRIYFITGSDEAAVKSTAASLADALTSTTDVLAREIIDGAAENTNQAIERILNTVQALLTFPFFQETKLVWLKNASMLADSGVSRSETLTATLEKLLHILEEGLPNGILFLLSAPEADKRRTFYKALSKLAHVTICDKPNFGWNSANADIVEWLRQMGVRYSLSFEPSALDLLAARIGADTRQAESEFEKLVSAFPIPPSLITESIVRELVPSTRESGIFDLSNALFNRNIRQCLESLQQLFFQGERAIGILLVAIVPAVRNLLLAKDLMEHHGIRPPTYAGAFSHSVVRLPSETTTHLPKKKDGTLNAYALGLAAMSATRYSLAELKLAFRECLETNRLILAAPLNEAVVLTRLLVRIVGQNSPLPS